MLHYLNFTMCRCHWCKLLDPVWQQTAEQLPDQPFAKDVRMAKVDCEANGQLCQEHSIRAYPTIQVYMHGENSESPNCFHTCQSCHEAAQNTLKLWLLFRRTAAPAETYYGDRTSEAFFAWMGHEHKILSAEQAAAKAAEGNAPTPAAGGSGDEAAPIRMHARGSKGVEGCMMEGSLRVKRVPVRTLRRLHRSATGMAGATCTMLLTRVSNLRHVLCCLF